ncbi:MAG: WG repeat-containing protein [Saprospiraceae bacterium]|nr:WG repeat-containing protein [Saprospiraceae bacterium]
MKFIICKFTWRFAIMFMLLNMAGLSCSTSQSDPTTYSTEYLACVTTQDGKYGFIDEAGHEVIPCKFDGPGVFSEGWVALKKGNNWAYYDVNGKIVLDLKNRFAYCGPFHDGAAFVSDVELDRSAPIPESTKEAFRQELQYIDTLGNVLFKIKNQWDVSYLSLRKYGFKDGMLKMTTAKDTTTYITRFGHLDKKGRLAIPFTHRVENNVTEEFSEGLAGVGLREYLPGQKKPISNYGYLNKSGEWHIPPIYRTIYPFHKGVAIVGVAQDESRQVVRFHLIDREGNRVFPEGVETYPRLQRDSFIVVIKKEYSDKGYYKSNSARSALAKIDGTMITDFIYEDLHPGKTSDDPWLAKLPGKENLAGFIDDQGKIVIPFQFAGGGSYSFENGFAVVRLKTPDRPIAVINKEGEFVIPPDSAKVNYETKGLISRITLKKPHQISYYDQKGQRIHLDEYWLCSRFNKVR